MINSNEYQTKSINPDLKLLRQIRDKLNKSKDDKELIRKVAEIVNVKGVK